ncbi:MAG: ATP-binding protein, partial [Gammaproteobacteria bacterium]|nr:ATP-binding protein [Gammaproteobacteria bacterium]
EAAKLQGATTDQQRVELEQASTEADQLLLTFNALLRIARIEAGKQRAGFKNVDLAALITDVAELYEPLADEKKQRLVVNTTHASCTGDRDLLFQAVANLVDNAVKHTPENGEIQITLRPYDDNGTDLVVSDQGPGIPEEHTDHVFQRFYRLDRSRNTPGSGLGLSLVAAVAELHKIKIELQNLDPGLRVSLHMPA